MKQRQIFIILVVSIFVLLGIIGVLLILANQPRKPRPSPSVVARTEETPAAVDSVSATAAEETKVTSTTSPAAATATAPSRIAAATRGASTGAATRTGSVISGGGPARGQVKLSPAEELAQAREADKTHSANRQQLYLLFSALQKEADEPVEVVPGEQGGILSMAFSPDGKLLAAAGADHSVILYDFATRKAARKLQGHGDAVTDVCFSTDGKRLLSSAWDGSIIFWNVSTGQAETRLKNSSPLLRCAPLPDGKHAVTTGIGVQFWDLEKKKLIGEEPARMEVRALCISPKGKVATGNCAGELVVWDGVTGKAIERKQFGEWVYAAYFTGEDTLMVRYTRGPLALWNMKTGTMTNLGMPPGKGVVDDDNKELTAEDVRQLLSRSSVPFHTGLNAFPLYDPSGKYKISTDGGTLTQAGYNLEGPSQIQLFDLSKQLDFERIQREVSAFSR